MVSGNSYSANLRLALCRIVTSLITVACPSVCAKFQVNNYTSYDQTDPAIAIDPNGGFLVVWRSYRQDGDSGGIFARQFDACGNPLGLEFIVNSETIGNQKAPDAAMDGYGNFVVVWQGPGIDQEDIFARRFGCNAQPLDTEFTVNTYTDNRQLSPAVAMNHQGRFLVVWESINIPADPNKRSICGRLYDSNGNSIGSEFVINNEASTCRFPDAVMLEDGSSIVVWVRESTLKSIWVRFVNAVGNTPTLAIMVNEDNFTSLTQPSVACDAAGNFIILWDGHETTYLEDDIYLRRFHWSHAPLENAVIISGDPGQQSLPAAVMAPDGRFVALWQNEPNNDSETDIFAQRFPTQNENIGPVLFMGTQFQINPYSNGSQQYPAVVINDSADFVAVWESYAEDGSGYGIFGQIGFLLGSADLTGDNFIDFCDFTLLADRWLNEQVPLYKDIFNDGNIDTLDLAIMADHWLQPAH
ncbi:MAG: hypothetical protein ABIG61_01895 [Planctomycetota bacterium]